MNLHKSQEINDRIKTYENIFLKIGMLSHIVFFSCAIGRRWKTLKIVAFGRNERKIQKIKNCIRLRWKNTQQFHFKGIPPITPPSTKSYEWNGVCAWMLWWKGLKEVITWQKKMGSFQSSSSQSFAIVLLWPKRQKRGYSKKRTKHEDLIQ